MSIGSIQPNKNFNSFNVMQDFGVLIASGSNRPTEDSCEEELSHLESVINKSEKGINTARELLKTATTQEEINSKSFDLDNRIKSLDNYLNEFFDRCGGGALVGENHLKIMKLVNKGRQVTKSGKIELSLLQSKHKKSSNQKPLSEASRGASIMQSPPYIEQIAKRLNSSFEQAVKVANSMKYALLNGLDLLKIADNNKSYLAKNNVPEWVSSPLIPIGAVGIATLLLLCTPFLA